MQNQKTIYIMTALFLSFFLTVHPSLADERELGNLKEHLREQLYLAQTYENFRIKREELHAADLLIHFYEKRGFQPAWLKEGTLSSSGETLFSLLWQSHLEGLHPEEYHLHTINGIWMELSTEMASIDSNLMVEMDILLTNAFFVYASDLQAGRLNQKSLEREWVKETTFDPITVLEEILENPEERRFQELSPSHRQYNRLVELIPLYWEIMQQGGWPHLPEGITLEKGDQNHAVALLRKRLLQEPFQRIDLQVGAEDVYNHHLQEAVMDFQRRYHLEVTGQVDDATRSFLNKTVEEILHQIVINLERWRWFPPYLEDRYILVNLPDFGLLVVESGETTMEMRIIIGHDQQKTPAFNSRISHLVLSPRWYIPTSLAIRTYLPMVKNEPEQLEEMRIRIYERTDAGFEEIDVASVDWEDVDTGNFQYYFWQDAGPWNRLGKVIFMFPNPYHVYVHDTPDKYLFNRRVRTFSEGCIRIEEPMELALYLLANNQQWSIERIEETVAKRTETTVFLPQSIPIFIQYSTAWVDDRGMLHLRNDIYQKDPPLKNAYLLSAFH